MNPFNSHRAQSAASLGESRLIEAIRGWLGDASPSSPKGIGDDCAVFQVSGGNTRGLVTTDPVLWGRHFDETVAPEDVAGKLFRRNLSDVAAMGGRPITAVLSLLLPPTTSLEWLKRFHLGLRDASALYGVPLSGGDISQTDGLLAACMTLIGESTGPRLLLRKGAAEGDHLFVTGALGGSRLGHHFSFEPRLKEGEWLAAREEVVAGMDISDGLAKDLPALIPPGSAAELFPHRIPVSRDAEISAEKSGRSPLHHALCDGEDHELLIAVRKSADLPAFVADWEKRFPLSLTCIGRLVRRDTDADGPLLRGLPEELSGTIQGYEHLR